MQHISLTFTYPKNMTRTEKSHCQTKIRLVIGQLEKIHQHFWCDDLLFKARILQTQINKRKPSPGRRDGRT